MTNGGIAHRKHPVGETFETLGEHVVLEERRLDVGFPGKVEGDARREETVAEPSGALAMRAVGEDVDGILAEGELRGAINLLETRIGAVEGRFARRRIGVFAEVKALEFKGALETEELQISTNLRLDAFKPVEPIRVKRPLCGGAASKAQEVQFLQRVEDFVERNGDFRFPFRFHLETEESAEVGAEVEDLRVGGMIRRALFEGFVVDERR